MQEPAPNETKFNEYAVVDLGSNSFHIIISRKNAYSLQTIYKNKHNIRLASGLNSQNELDNESIERGLSCLVLFAERLSNFPPENVRVVATYALRVAKNRAQFLRRAADIFPYPIEIVSGSEEARLIYLGATNSESAQQSEIKCVIDIGGGSTEIAIGKTDLPYIVESRPMGCITFNKQYFPQQKISRYSFDKAQNAAKQHVKAMIERVKKENITLAFGSSGTIKSIYNILLDIGVTDGIITPKRLDDLISYILQFDSFSDLDYPSLSSSRKLIFVSGLAIFSGVFSAFNIQALYYCQGALREGVLYEMTDSLGMDDIRQNTAISLSNQYNIDQKHANQVVMTTKSLFYQWKTQVPNIIDESLEQLLYWAALLHEIGLQINLSSIQKHSAYILQHCNMPGFNEEQQQLLATLVRYHRKSINLNTIPYFSLFDTKQIYPLIQILRLAVLLNNQRQLSININAIQLYINQNEPLKIELQIESECIEHNKLILLDLKQEKRQWRALKNWDLIITVNNPKNP